MSNYRRNFVAGGCYFFSVNLLDRQQSLLTDHIDLLRDSVRRVRRLYPFHIDACVILPDHLHCVWTLPPDSVDYPVRWRLIKLLFSKGLPRTERLSATRRQRSERGIWQRRYWEHTIVTERDYQQHIDYIHVNPLKHGLVTRVQDWPHSTFHRYVLDGVLPSDWCGEINALPSVSD
ncbi:transposase [Methylicorpusculum sp.]|uniref:REP-associated tyrosine transposase n=1 Tax=Methylicorpusculum sp. TaxID=2713644 RepID=UPI0027194C63|nr:transposase [Methylicorpusculum sp.]MDO8842921.1 transposase [Methylicorpusculum sp.]